MRIAKNIKRVISIFLAAVIIAVVLPIASSAAGNVQQIYDFLVTEMGLNSAAACGVLANIECESDFNPYLWGDYGTSYGICQWHKGRLTNMQVFCDKNGYDWKNLEGQLHFLKYELTNNRCDTGYIIDKLMSVTDDADGAYKAAYDWCFYFERPANKENKSVFRGDIAKTTYWPLYGNKQPSRSFSIGDVDNNGVVNSADALIIVESSVGARVLNSNQAMAADVNHDGNVTSTDALIVLNCSAGVDRIENYR